MPETLDTLAAKIDALSNTFAGRFDRVDKRFNEVDKRFDGVDKRLDGVDKRFRDVDKRFDELKNDLLVRIEAVDTKVDLVLEQVGHLGQRDVANSVAHARLEARLDNHELRITALERLPKPS